MKSRRSALILCLLLMAGALAGGIAGEFLSQFPNMDWMSFGGVNGYRELFSVRLDPAVDIRILRFGLDFTLKVNAGSLIGMAIGIILFFRT